MEYQFSQPQTGKIATDPKFPQLSGGSSSDLGFSVGVPTSFSPPADSKFSLFLQDMEGPGVFPCTMEAMREAIFRVAAMQPVEIDTDSVKPPPERKNVRISKDPQSVAARRRRERISHRIRVLQRMVPGGTKLDTASMLDEAAHYLKFLKKQVQSLEQAAAAGNYRPTVGAGFFPVGLALD